MSLLGSTEEYQVEQIAAGLGVSPGDVVRRMIEAAFGGSEQDQVFLSTLRRFRDADEPERMNLTRLLKVMVVQSPQMPVTFLAGRSNVIPLPGSSQPIRAGHPTQAETDAKRLALIAALQQWNAEDATDDPAEIARRESEWGAIGRNIEANRVNFPVVED